MSNLVNLISFREFALPSVMKRWSTRVVLFLQLCSVSVAFGQGGAGAEALASPIGPSGGASLGVSAPAISNPSLVARPPSSGARDLDGGNVRREGGDTRLPPSPLAITEFQRFVQAATGRSLALFGYSMFGGAGFQSLQNVPVPAEYVIGPGDEIALRIWGAVDADLRLAVDRNGQVNIPRVGTITLAGVKSSQLEGVIRGHVGRVYNNFQLSATLGQLRSIQLFVVGQARQPGAYTVSSLSTFVSALFESGGPSASGSMRNIQLKRDGKTVSTLDLYKFINEGDKSADVRLMPGDVIVIPPAGPRVALQGALDQPGIYELLGSEEPLGKVLAYAGRTQALTSIHKVHVERIDVASARAPRLVEERALDRAGLEKPLRDGDVVSLFRISPEFGNAVTLRGNVASPLRYAFKPGMRVSDLIPERDALLVPDYHARRNVLVQYESGREVSSARLANEVKNLVDEINWDYAVVERLDPSEVRSKLLPFNLSKAVRDRDPASNLELRPGDVVTIFGVKDLPVPVEKRTQYVTVAGEVSIPGVYQLKPGETLEQVIQRAGGFTQNAYPYGTLFVRESTRVLQQENLDRAIRRMETDINSQAATAIQNLRDGTRGEEALQTQIASQKALLSKIRTLKASGRIALELDPRSMKLPHIALEDGDQITIPTSPSFVGIFGAVAAETSFLHRQNFTVADYLDRAGLTRDADLDFVAIVRADGSLDGVSTAERGFFSLNQSTLDKRLNPGDSIFVPEKFDKRSGYLKFMDVAKDLTTVFYQFGLGAAALKTIRN
jgi:protein involved in polysaccharide export with SLBB domain